MSLIEEHLLSLPFGLPGGRDERLVEYLKEDDWGSALTLLRDVVTPETQNPKWLLLLAYVRFRDAAEIMVDELGAASREALGLIDRAMALGSSYEAVAPLREAVEEALDEVSREEVRVLGVIEGTPLEQVGEDDLEAAAVLLWKSDPKRASGLFEALAGRVEGPRGMIAKTHALVSLAEAGATEGLKGRLEAVTGANWNQPGLTDAASVLESAEAALLMLVRGQEFEVAWTLAEQRGKELEFPFPSVWPNQDKLLARCLELGDLKHARALAATIEDARPERSKAISELMAQARMASA